MKKHCQVLNGIVGRLGGREKTREKNSENETFLNLRLNGLRTLDY